MMISLHLQGKSLLESINWLKNGQKITVLRDILILLVATSVLEFKPQRNSL